MKQIIFIFTCIVLVFKIQSVKAIFKPEKLFVRNIHLKNGLSQCVVTDIVQDSRGFVWAGTFDGLNRFDGHNIKVYRHNPEDSNSIISSKIYKVFADLNDHLYLKTNEGFCIFDCKTEKIIKPELMSRHKPGWITNRDQFHIWYYAAQGGLMLIDTRDFSYKLMPEPQSNMNEPPQIVRIFERESKVYTVTDKGDLLVYDLKSNQNIFLKNNLIANGSYVAADIDKQGKIYIGSNVDDLIIFDTRKMQFLKSDFHLKNSNLIGVNAIQYDSINNLLFLTSYGQGLFVYEYETDRVLQYKKSNPILSLASNYPLAICINRYGIVYITYDGMGIDVLDPYIRKFIPLTYQDAGENNNLKYVRKIIEDDAGNLFIGTSESGLVRYDRKTGNFSFYNYVNSLSENRAFILELLKLGHDLWLGYNGSGISIVDISSMREKKRISVGKERNQISNGAVWSFLKDAEGNIWVGTRENGLNKINTANDEVTQYTKEKFPDFANNGIRCMYQFQNAELILGTETGIYKFDKIRESLQKVFPLTQTSGSFKSIKSIYRDFKNRFWVSTDGGGIVVLNEKYELLKNFNTTNGLINNVVYGILPHKDTSFWISTNAGISNIRWNENSLSPKGTLNTQNYDEMNGLQSNEFNTGAYALLSDGSMAFGGLNGINIFNPSEIKEISVNPMVYIQEFKIFETPFKSDINISYLNKVRLEHFENSISITFGTIGFSIPEKTSYQYRLLGYDKDWIHSYGRNYVSYTNLASGRYQFQVRASNYDGIWSKQYSTLDIVIATPFYQSTWFYFIIALLAACLIFIIVKMRMKQIRDREKITLKFTKELAEVEMKALRAQINPHFLFNSLNSINNYILKNDTKTASKYLIKFSQLVRNILSNSSTPFVTLQEELQTIELYIQIEGMRFGNQFSYVIDVDERLNTGAIRIPSLLLHPYVENAIWHGLLHKEGEKNIKISVKPIGNSSLGISIEDNGVGRKAAEEIEQRPGHKSFGMQIGENRLRLLNQSNGQTCKVEVVDLYDSEQQPCGTKIEIVIPAKILIHENTLLN